MGLNMQEIGGNIVEGKEGTETGREIFRPPCRFNTCERRERAGWLGRPQTATHF